MAEGMGPIGHMGRMGIMGIMGDMGLQADDHGIPVRATKNPVVETGIIRRRAGDWE